MNSSRMAGWLFVLLSSVCFGEPEFIGVISTTDGTRIALRLEGGEAVWVGLGQKTEEYVVSTYDPKNETVLLKRTDSSELKLQLKTSSVKPAPTVEMFKDLMGSADRETKLLYLRTLEVDARRKITALKIDKEQLHGAVESSELMINLRKQLAADESKLAQQLSLLMKAFEAASKDAGNER